MDKVVEDSFTIRAARLEDIGRLTALLQDLFQIEADFIPNPVRQEEGLARLFRKPGAVILVAESSGKAVGMCTLQKVISTAEGGLVPSFINQRNVV